MCIKYPYYYVHNNIYPKKPLSIRDHDNVLEIKTLISLELAHKTQYTLARSVTGPAPEAPAD